MSTSPQRGLGRPGETGRHLVADVLGMSGEKVERDKEDTSCLNVPKEGTAGRRGAREV